MCVFSAGHVSIVYFDTYNYIINMTVKTVAGHVSIVFWYIIFSVNNNICQTMSDNVKQLHDMLV